MNTAFFENIQSKSDDELNDILNTVSKKLDRWGYTKPSELPRHWHKYADISYYVRRELLERKSQNS